MNGLAINEVLKFSKIFSTASKFSVISIKKTIYVANLLRISWISLDFFTKWKCLRNLIFSPINPSKLQFTAMRFIWPAGIVPLHSLEIFDEIWQVLKERFLWGVPKKKTSKRVKRHRTRLKIPKNLKCIYKCPICGDSYLQHHLCLSCLAKYWRYVKKEKAKFYTSNPQSSRFDQ